MARQASRMAARSRCQAVAEGRGVDLGQERPVGTASLAAACGPGGPVVRRAGGSAARAPRGRRSRLRGTGAGRVRRAPRSAPGRSPAATGRPASARSPGREGRTAPGTGTTWAVVSSAGHGRTRTAAAPARSTTSGPVRRRLNRTTPMTVAFDSWASSSPRTPVIWSTWRRPTTRSGRNGWARCSTVRTRRRWPTRSCRWSRATPRGTSWSGSIPATTSTSCSTSPRSKAAATWTLTPRPARRPGRPACSGPAGCCGPPRRWPPARHRPRSAPCARPGTTPPATGPWASASSTTWRSPRPRWPSRASGCSSSTTTRTTATARRTSSTSTRPCSTCRSTSGRSIPAPAAWPRRGEGAGFGCNLNIPLPPRATGDVYLEAIDRIVAPLVELFEPDLAHHLGRLRRPPARPASPISASPSGDYALMTAAPAGAGAGRPAASWSSRAATTCRPSPTRRPRRWPRCSASSTCRRSRRRGRSRAERVLDAVVGQLGRPAPGLTARRIGGRAAGLASAWSPTASPRCSTSSRRWPSGSAAPVTGCTSSAGTVRDLLVGRDAAAATSTPPPTPAPTRSRPSSAAGPTRVWTQGERFGTIGARRGERDYEITTHRAEAYDPDSRKPDVVFADADRGRPVPPRLHRQRHGAGADDRRPALVDPFGGAADLAAGVLRTPARARRRASATTRCGCCGPPASSPATGWSRCPSWSTRSTAMHHRLAIVSAERIRDELDKLIVVDRPGPRPVVRDRHRPGRGVPARAAGHAPGAGPDPPPQGRAQPHHRRGRERPPPPSAGRASTSGAPAWPRCSTTSASRRPAATARARA